MKLKVGYELNISQENEALIPIIAKIEGWNPDSGVTAQQYINENVVKERVGLMFKELVQRAVSAYFGIAGQTNADQVMYQYEGAHSVTSEFINS